MHLNPLHTIKLIRLLVAIWLATISLTLFASLDKQNFYDLISKPVWHNSLRLPDGEKLSEAQWATVADDYMSRMGFNDTHLRCYVLHNDEAGQHIHIIASRIDITDGKLYLGKMRTLPALELSVSLKEYMVSQKQRLLQTDDLRA